MNPSLRNISYIFLMMVSDRLSEAGVHLGGDSIIHIILFLLVGSTWRLLIMVITIWMFRDLLSVLLAITPM